MKKLVKVLSLLALSVVVCLSIVAFAACSSGTAYEGEYHYNSHNTEYGMVVKVTVDNGKITKVENITGTKYVACSAVNPDYGWTQDKVDNWNNNVADLLKVYEGKTVAEVKALTVTKDDVGVPSAVSNSDYVVTGATQGSGRLLLAVQNALSKIEG